MPSETYPIPPSYEHVFPGDSELARLMRALDWASTPLGPTEAWPQALKTCLRILLTSRQPMWLGWGEQLTYFYNDPYKSIIGGKHPWALGRPTAEVWQEIWGEIGPRIRTTREGKEGTYDEALLLIMQRHGYAEETYYTFSYSPVLDEQGGVGGLFCANTDDTRRVIGERQLALLRELAARTVDTRTVEDACAASARALETNPHDLPFALVYLIEADPAGGQRAILAGTANLTRGHPAAPEVVPLDDVRESTAWPLAEVVRTNTVRVVSDFGSAIGALPVGAWVRPPRQGLVLPVAPSSQTGRAALLVVGLNPYRLLDDSYRGFLDLVAGQIAAAIGSAHAREEERRRAEALAALDRAKTAFFSNVSHEFRTPLTLMLGPLEDILAKPEGGVLPENRELLTIVHRSSLRLLRLVNTLLDFSRIESGRIQAWYEPTNLPALTAELASSFEAAVERAGLRLVVDCPPLADGIAAYVDREMWEKIVLNLLSNALKFTFQGEIAISLRASDDQRSLALTVRDTGTGIPEDELPRVFERFHRVEKARARTHEGTGIGLALVQELTRLHGGSVAVESVVDRGTTVTVAIPMGQAHLPPDRVGAARTLAPAVPGATPFVEEALRWLPGEPGAPEPGSEDEAVASLSPRGSSPPVAREPGAVARVLLADDSADMRAYVTRLLAPRYEVEAVPDGAAALAAARERPPDLVLSDVMMPRLDGFGLLRALREDPRTREVPVVLLSARAGEEATVEGIEAGADDYLVKPFSARELLARVSTHLSLARLRAEAVERERGARAEADAARLRLGAIFAQAAVGIAQTDLEGRFLLVNERYGEIVGRPLAELLGGPRARDFTYPDDLAPNSDLFERMVRDGTSFALEKRYVRPDGTQVWVRNSVARVDDPDGTPRYVVVVSEDITERTRAEAEARRQREDLYALLMQAPVPIAVLAGPDLVFELANPLYLQVVGGRDLAGKPVLEALPELRGQGYDDLLRNVLRTGQPVVASESPVKLAWDGVLQDTYWTFIHAPLHNREGVADRVMAICNNVTDQVRARQQVEEALRVRDQFLATVAHDLRTPLTAIKGYAQMLRRQVTRVDVVAAGRLGEGLAQIEATSGKMAAMINELLDVTRLELGEQLALELQPTDLVALARRVAAEHQRATERHRVRVEAAEAEVVGAWDVARLERVLDNLLTNAVKYSPDGGDVTVTVARQQDAPTSWALLAVRDQGIGVPTEDLPRIFERFHRGQNVPERIAGIGLGLAGARKLVELHGGTLTVESGEGAGSTFTVRLPLTPKLNVSRDERAGL